MYPFICQFGFFYTVKFGTHFPSHKLSLVVIIYVCSGHRFHSLSNDFQPKSRLYYMLSKTVHVHSCNSISLNYHFSLPNLLPPHTIIVTADISGLFKSVSSFISRLSTMLPEPLFPLISKGQILLLFLIYF